MNTYQSGETSLEKIITIKRYFASLIFEIISPLVGSTPTPLISIHKRFQSPNWYIYETTYII